MTGTSQTCHGNRGRWSARTGYLPHPKCPRLEHTVGVIGREFDWCYSAIRFPGIHMRMGIPKLPYHIFLGFSNRITERPSCPESLTRGLAENDLSQCHDDPWRDSLRGLKRLCGLAIMSGDRSVTDTRERVPTRPHVSVRAPNAVATIRPARAPRCCHVGKRRTPATARCRLID